MEDTDVDLINKGKAKVNESVLEKSEKASN
jgi:hypothetical protein